MSNLKQKPSYPDGRAATIGALLLGVGLPCLLCLVEGGLPQSRGRGSGSDMANGMVMYLIPLLAVVGAVGGAFLGELLALITFAIAWLRARRS